MSDDPKKQITSIDDALKAIDDDNMMPPPVFVKPREIKSKPDDISALADDDLESEIVPTSVTVWMSEKDMPPQVAVDKLRIPVRRGKTDTASGGKLKKSDTTKLPKIEQSDDALPDDTLPDDEAADIDIFAPETELDIGPSDFKMKFDFESAYKDAPDDRPIRLRREKRTGLVGGLLFSTFVICVSLILASIVWMATVDILGFASKNELVNITVPQGFTIEGVTDMLYDAGLIRYRSLFNLYADYSNAEEKISAGSYVLNKNFDYRALVQGMTARAGVRVETTVTIPEGLTLAQIFTLLDNSGVCPAEELWYAATHHEFNFSFLDESTLGNRLRLEGYLFPDTYNFYMDSTPVQALLRMLREFGRRFSEDLVERAEDMEYTIHEIITIASMIEREAGDDAERPRIAAVIYNRLNNSNFPHLEIDATIHYAIAGTGIPFSIELEHEYNTYVHEGLPPGPIASPGMASINAALYPDSTNEYFYALNRHGTHNFFTNYNDHINFVRSSEYGG